MYNNNTCTKFHAYGINHNIYCQTFKKKKCFKNVFLRRIILNIPFISKNRWISRRRYQVNESWIPAMLVCSLSLYYTWLLCESLKPITLYRLFFFCSYYTIQYTYQWEIERIKHEIWRMLTKRIVPFSVL